MEKSQTPSDLSPLPDEAKRLRVFLGNWKVEGTLTFAGKPLKVKGVWNFDSAAAGWGVLAKMKMDVEDMGNYEEVDIAGFDPGEGLIHIFSVTNTAATHDHKGKWLDDNTLEVVYEGLQEGKRYKEQVAIRFLGEREFSISEVDSLEGQAVSTMEST